MSTSLHSLKTIRPVLLVSLTEVKSISPFVSFVLVPCSIGNSLYRCGIADCILSPRKDKSHLLVLPHELLCTHCSSQPVASCYGNYD